MKKKKRRQPPKGFKPHRCSVLVKNIDRSVRDGFKAYCARRGISMRYRLEELMKQDAISDIKRLRNVEVLRRPPC